MNSGPEQHGEIFHRYWPAEIVALRFIAVLRLKKCKFLLGFHSLRDYSQLQGCGPC